MIENKKNISPSKIREDCKDDSKTKPNSIQTNLKLLVEEKSLFPKTDFKTKDTLLQKNLTCESPILKIAKKQKSKQIAEMLGELPDPKVSSVNSINSLENDFPRTQP